MATKKKTGNGPVARKASPAKAKATGQSASSSMDAVTRRWDTASGTTHRRDRLSGVTAYEKNGKTKYQVNDRKTAKRVGGLTGYAATLSDDPRGGMRGGLTGKVMNTEAKSYMNKVSSAPKRASVNPKTKKKPTSK